MCVLWLVVDMIRLSRFLIGYRNDETRLRMRKIKTKAELKGLAQVPHPSFTQVTDDDHIGML